jgi:hypothetical protein
VLLEVPDVTDEAQSRGGCRWRLWASPLNVDAVISALVSRKTARVEADVSAGCTIASPPKPVSEEIMNGDLDRLADHQPGLDGLLIDVATRLSRQLGTRGEREGWAIGDGPGLAVD